MTEAEWLSCTDSDGMLRTVEANASERKLRLFLVAYARSVWDQITDEDCRMAVETAERRADLQVSEEELRAISTRMFV
jgi:hypothetical protein